MATLEVENVVSLLRNTILFLAKSGYIHITTQNICFQSKVARLIDIESNTLLSDMEFWWLII